MPMLEKQPGTLAACSFAGLETSAHSSDEATINTDPTQQYINKQVSDRKSTPGDDSGGSSDDRRDNCLPPG